MRTTITVDDQMFEKLMQLTDTDNKTEAVNRAIHEFIRQERLKRFKKLRGKLDMPSNDELEGLELERAWQLAGASE